MTNGTRRVYGGTPPIAARSEGLRTPNAVTVKRDRLSPNRKGEWSIPSHLFLALLPDNSWAFLPESKVEKDFVGNKGYLELEQVFTKGDVLWIMASHQQLTFAGVTSGASITFSLPGPGYSATYTWKGAMGSSPTRLVMNLQKFFADDPYFSNRIYAVVNGETLYLFSHPPFNRLNIISTTDVGTITTYPEPSPAIGNPFAPAMQIGTIASIDRSGEIMLEADVPFLVPKGANVGVLTKQIIGYHPHATDWSNKSSMVLTAIEQGTVRVADMPYWRDGISQLLIPDISYQPAFN